MTENLDHKKTNMNYKKILNKISIDLIDVDTQLELTYPALPKGYLKESIIRTGGEPIYPLVGCRQNDSERIMLLSGVARLDDAIDNNRTHIEILIIDACLDASDRKLMIYDLNKSRIKDGKTRFKEFLVALELYPQRKGGKSNRYSLGSMEFGVSKNEFKELVMLYNFFKGDGDVVIEKILGKEISRNQANKLKAAVEEYPEKFNSSELYDKLTNRNYDLGRLSNALKNFSLDKEDEFKIIEKYLLKDYDFESFENLNSQKIELDLYKSNHEDNKVFVPILTDEFITENSRIIKGDNRKVNINLPDNEKIKCLISSCEYGNKRKNSDTKERKIVYEMDGRNFAIYNAETIERFIPELSEDSSVYMIVDDYLYKGSQACFLEYFVIEMLNKGFHLVSRYNWVKSNSMPRNYKCKRVQPNFEMVYRFTLNPKLCYTNPNVFIEGDNGIKVSKGCVNHSSNGLTSKGGNYIQGNIKKPKNSLSWDVLDKVIKSNCANPDNFFRQSEEKYHNSQFPPELCAFFIHESTRKGDLCADVWNGVGNSMTATLLSERKYLGVEMEDDYYQQTCRRVKYYENFVKGEELYPLFSSLIEEEASI